MKVLGLTLVFMCIWANGHIRPLREPCARTPLDGLTQAPPRPHGGMARAGLHGDLAKGRGAVQPRLVHHGGAAAHMGTVQCAHPSRCALNLKVAVHVLHRRCSTREASLGSTLLCGALRQQHGATGTSRTHRAAKCRPTVQTAQTGTKLKAHRRPSRWDYPAAPCGLSVWPVVGLPPQQLPRSCSFVTDCGGGRLDPRFASANRALGPDTHRGPGSERKEPRVCLSACGCGPRSRGVGRCCLL